MKMDKLAIGIDIGGTNTAFGFVARDGRVVANGTIPTQVREDFNDFVDDLKTAIDHTRKEIDTDFELIGIGIGAPNGNYYSGTIEYAPNLRWKGILPVISSFEEAFGIPAVLTNDANAAAIGEMVYGSAKDLRDFIMITLGTGVGSGIVVNGELVYGHDGFAGELGHMIIKENGRECGCGRMGCLEAYCSAPGIKKTALKLIAQNKWKSTLCSISPDRLDSRKVAEAALTGDELALEVFDYTGRILGLALANAVAFSSPKAIFLFGGPTQAGDILFQPLRKYFEESLLPIYKNKVELLPSGLPPGDAAIVGASALAWKEFNL